MPELLAAHRRAQDHLLSLRDPRGHWRGFLASSALSTATACVALAQVDAVAHRERIVAGLDWLRDHANTDGGWGDTTNSISNINTTALCWAALACAPAGMAPRWAGADAGAQAWIMRATGTLTASDLTRTILAFYGDDRTFSTPICSLLALTGRLGPEPRCWDGVPALPFELAAAPRGLWRFLRLPVVSYALPALVAIGQVRHTRRSPAWPLRILRDAVIARTLRVVEAMQPSHGGFLEAVPLTSFVCACLAGAGRASHPIVTRCVNFLKVLRREDGSWPIDTDLATWATTLSVNALAASDDLDRLGADGRNAVREWLLAQQYRHVHPFTDTPPGAWAWSDLEGAVPDADDTPGALLALHHLEGGDARVPAAAARGIAWLLGLRNRDGGEPTFCRGWGKLPFDRSADDITAHTLASWARWQQRLPRDLARRSRRAIAGALAYLGRRQRTDGSWLPLWFGNQHVPDQVNPCYGTARVLIALASARRGDPTMVARGAGWLLAHQHADGAWGGDRTAPPSVEETALAVDALASLLLAGGAATWPGLDDAALRAALERGADRLVALTDGGRDFPPTPIGLYFAKLWYHDLIYPVVFTVQALAKARKVVEA